MKNRKINATDLVNKIEKLAKSRIAGQEVVPLDAFRETKKKLEPKSILVIEDDESMRSALKRILDSEHYISRIAADATELSSVLDDHPVDLILLDIGLPWINGFELAQMLKEHRDLKAIPLVFISGSASDEDVKKAFKLGADDFLKKPFDIELLKKTLSSLLRVNG
ncbi:MAG TPA: response regulator [Pseudobdellovibrionaceae bacterium]|jgi:two-component system aerobic respiration control protein ArcA|nr:response regulator [Pseudobdellovibrionaceae bacterium]